MSFMRQKSKVEWLKDGDENTGFFHRQIKARHIQNKVLSIKDIHGTLHKEPVLIENAFLEFYTDLLGTSRQTSSVHIPIVRTGKLITDHQKYLLLRPVTYDEIKKCIFSIPSSKAPGPDGYSSQFFKDSWAIIGNDVSAAIIDFFNTGQLLKQLNATLVTLIPKGGFIKERNIVENVLIYQDLSMLVALNFPTGFIDRIMTYGIASSIMWMLRAFSTFSKASGLCFNRERSDIYFNGVPSHVMADIIQLTDRITARIRSWGTRQLSYTGRLALINSVLTSLHSYWASMFLIPNGIMNKIGAICRNFLWSGKDSYQRSPNVSWDRCCSPKDEGGLGIKDLKIWNRALLGKYIWWLAKKKDHL
ncbi:uncharacterized protein LOC141658950 [Silene latifolia]|uniref:uncharacterized protein LOC141658950 n=1 Tax=Silene latifolia TaxID=37657 RepID=UPI003D76B561